jgi:hypothetical protein
MAYATICGMERPAERVLRSVARKMSANFEEMTSIITHNPSKGRIVEAVRPTILLDEVDAIFGSHASKDHEDLRALLNAGHRPGAAVLRVIGDGGNMRAHEFNAYCPVGLAGLGYLPTTIASRSITIPMRRRAPDEQVRPFRERVTRPEGEALRRRLAAWVSRHADDIPEAPRLPAGVTDRSADCWEPLVAIGDAAGGAWPDLARNACVTIVKDTTDADDQSLGAAPERHPHGVWDQRSARHGHAD